MGQGVVKMKNGMCPLCIALLFSILLSMSCVALEGQTYSIPITLSVVNTVKHIDVTLPAAMPISVLNGKVLTADNLCIRNNSSAQNIRTVELNIQDGDYRIASYEHFPADESGRIALNINGCSTKSAGPLPLTEMAFPVIQAGGYLPIRYEAKVTPSGEHSQVSAASIIITLRAG